MAHIDENAAAGWRSVSLGNKLTWVKNLFAQGARDLALPRPASLPKSAHYIEIGNKGMRLCHRIGWKSKELTRDALVELSQETDRAPLDLVFTGDSCIDLTFTLPNAPLSELNQMIDSEIRFNSPFTSEASLWFCESEEQPDGRWLTIAAVTLKEPVEQLLSMLSELDQPVGLVERKQHLRQFVTQPDWILNAPRHVSILGVLKGFPSLLKMMLAGATVLLLSAGAFAGKAAWDANQMEAEASNARSAIAAHARTAQTQRYLEGAITQSMDKLALTGTLSAIFPKDVWLDQLIIENDTVTFVGFAPSAAEVTRLLTDVPMLSDIRFASPVTRDNTQSIERFRIAATLVEAQ